MKVPHILFQHVFAQPTSVRSSQPKSNASNSSFWERLWERFFSFDNQIQVLQKQDRAGNTYYQINDRFSGQTQTFSTAAEAIDWIERKRF